MHFVILGGWFNIHQMWKDLLSAEGDSDTDWTTANMLKWRRS